MVRCMLTFTTCPIALKLTKNKPLKTYSDYELFTFRQDSDDES